MSLADLEALFSAAQAALAAKDFDTAIQKATLCKFRLATTPNIMRVIVSGGQEQMTWANAAALDGFIKACQQMKSQQIATNRGPFQQTKIVYQRPDF